MYGIYSILKRTERTQYQPTGGPCNNAVWISEDALSLWSAPRRTTRGGQPHYSDLAIEMCLTLGLVFKQPLRQTQGLMRSIAQLLGVAIAVPDFSTLSRRGNGLTLRPKPKSKCDKPVQLVVDSTGLEDLWRR
nr:transposase [Sulfitobacter sp. M22]